MHALVDRKHKALRQTAKEVEPEEIAGARVKKIIADMKAVLNSEDDGVAIAAPQLGLPLRIFVVSGRVFDLKGRDGRFGYAHDLDGLREFEERKKEDKKTSVKDRPKDLVFINPRVLKTSKNSAFMVEGCLSLRWLYGNVKRKKKVTVEAWNEKGKKFTRGASGLLAQIFQHEIDHLEGILFTDKAKDVKDIPPELQGKHKYDE